MKIAYSEAGSGQALILLHGNGENRHYFDQHLEFFKNYYHVYAIDSRGHGDSINDLDYLSLSLMLEDLHHFIITHHLSNIILLGFSDGANYALMYAIKYPHAIDKLILIGGNLYPLGMKIKVVYDIIKEYLHSLHNIKQKQLLELMLFEPHLHPKDLKNMNIPTLVIASYHDMIRYAHTKKMARLIPNSKLHLVCGDHFSIYHNHNRINQYIIKYLKS